MIVIAANRYDMPARRLAERWAGLGGCLLTSEDLSAGGWRYRLDDPLNSTAVFGRREVKQSEIRGVLTRLSGVWEGELIGIVSDDRPYVAAEMSAFLLCWLSGLTCPVLNRPTASCLNGPCWGREQWVAAASSAGMRIRPVRRQISLASCTEAPPDSAAVTVTVAGERCLGDADKRLLVQARRLAEMAKVDLLSVDFSGPEGDAYFVGATACPEIDANGVEEAVLTHLRCI